jgi:hypothetical protein
MEVHLSKKNSIIILSLSLCSVISFASVLDKPADERRSFYKENSIKFESRCIDTVKPSQKVSPVRTVAPNYPSKASRRNVEGFVVMEFDLVQPKIPHHLSGPNVPEIFKDQASEYINSPKAIPVNINIIEHYPSGIFNRAATDALKQWVYKTQNNEKFIGQKCKTVHLDFLVKA